MDNFGGIQIEDGRNVTTNVEPHGLRLENE